MKLDTISIEGLKKLAQAGMDDFSDPEDQAFWDYNGRANRALREAQIAISSIMDMYLSGDDGGAISKLDEAMASISEAQAEIESMKHFLNEGF